MNSRRRADPHASRRVWRPRTRPPARADQQIRRAAFFDVDNTSCVARRSITTAWLAGSSARFEMARDRPIRRDQLKFRFIGAEDRPDHLSRPRTQRSIWQGQPGARWLAWRGGLRLGHDPADLSRHPCAGAATPRRRAARVAGHRTPVESADHRPPARADGSLGTVSEIEDAATPAGSSGRPCTAQRGGRGTGLAEREALDLRVRRTPTPRTTSDAVARGLAPAINRRLAAAAVCPRRTGGRCVTSRTGRTLSRRGFSTVAAGGLVAAGVALRRRSIR